jgi:hypothetical protein
MDHAHGMLGPMRSTLVLLLGLALPVSAEEPLSAEDFDALTRGRTYVYADEAGPYGAEEYREDREVIWSFLDGECIRGRWYAADEAICFVYEGIETPQCWHSFDEGGLRARFLGGGTDLKELGQTAEPLQCLGPGVGV